MVWPGSADSSSKLFGPEGVLEPVNVGDCTGDGSDVAGDFTTPAFSVLVTASETTRGAIGRNLMANSRIGRCESAETCRVRTDDDDDDDGKDGEAMFRPLSLMGSSLVTVGEDASLGGGRGSDDDGRASRPRRK